MFFESGIPVDWVHFDDIGRYRTLYFAYPIQLDPQHAAKLAEWVRAGGRLLCEGLPGYFAQGGRVCPAQPGNGLNEVFGVAERSVEFVPDLNDITFSALGMEGIPGAYFRQSYRCEGARALGFYPDGEAAVTCNAYGGGLAILTGTYPSGGYMRTASQLSRLYLNRLLGLAGVERTAELTGSDLVQYRLCANGEDRYVWLINHGGREAEVCLRMEGLSGVGAVLWGETGAAAYRDGGIAARVPGKDAVVVEVHWGG